jgi:putative transposase
MSDALRLRLIDQIFRLPDARLAEVERLLFRNTVSPAAVEERVLRDWPHAPLHRLSEHGTYIVTAATLDQQHYFRSGDRLDRVEVELLTLAKQMGWQLEAWAVFSNHYHFVAHALAGFQTLRELISELHRRTAGFANSLDGAAGRQVWFNYWDTELTFEKSYLARLNYVHQNAVKHGLVPIANQYRWCSAAWFERTASPAQVRTIYRFKTDQLKVEDGFKPV